MTDCKGTQNTLTVDEARGNGIFLSHKCEGGHDDDEKCENCREPTAVTETTRYYRWQCCLDNYYPARGRAK